MCSVILLRRPGHAWPLIVAANRDEMNDRPWLPPGRHWPDRPEVVAGKDELADGSWCGLNDSGVLAAVLNREGTLGPAAGKRSRGELVLEALDHADAPVEALSDLDTRAYRPFNLLLADNRDAWLLEHAGEAGRTRVRVTPISEGVSMITARGLNALDCPRTRRYRPLFAAAPAPDPETERWAEWEMLLASRVSGAGDDPREAMCIVTPPVGGKGGFETTSSSIIALPAMDRAGVLPRWRFAAGRPDEAPFLDVDLGRGSGPVSPTV
ncbi:transport and Golgi organization protein 2 [Nitrospirillum amazonense]|uniref:Transport and Golgi organization protein 2 n=1 Tax=Nitrospirillum amazonense TaxID=28077 RepID=A0A560FAV8_9PROT|nr:NRDE family protein [Nitrospirillum amazonense]TWB18695.1 transport and Golgi organization protein 2 [Nitrospirillum amazonense]